MLVKLCQLLSFIAPLCHSFIFHPYDSFIPSASLTSSTASRNYGNNINILHQYEPTSKCQRLTSITFNSALGPSSESFSSTFKISTKIYEYDGWRVSYKHKELTTSSEDVHVHADQLPPLFLIHPVGVGISNWFWDRIFQMWEGEIYAPNLIGCAQDGSIADLWDPQKRGLYLPLDWVRACEALIQQELVPQGKRCVVVTQGGLAPVGVLLAHRDTVQQTSYIQKLVLTSPPTWSVMTTSVPKEELERNYNFLSSPILGDLAFRFLESRGVIKFFSNLFLFKEECDSEWLEKTSSDTLLGLSNNSPDSKLLRPPVISFNAGVLNARSFMEEMIEITQKTLILAGDSDKRTEDRVGYVKQMKECSLKVIPGCNVLPWENASGTCEAINKFCKE